MQGEDINTGNSLIQWQIQRVNTDVPTPKHDIKTNIMTSDSDIE